MTTAPAAQNIVIIVDSNENRGNPLRITRFPTTVEPLRLVMIPPGSRNKPDEPVLNDDWKYLTFDYGVVGFSSPAMRGFAVERKSIADLAGSLSGGRKNFCLHMEAMRFYDFAALLIEGSREQIENREYRADVAPDSIFATLDAIQVRAGIQVCWAGDPWRAARQVENWADQYCGGIEKRGRLIGMGFRKGNHSEIPNSSPPEPPPAMDIGDPLAGLNRKVANRHVDFVRKP